MDFWMISKFFMIFDLSLARDFTQTMYRRRNTKQPRYFLEVFVDL